MVCALPRSSLVISWVYFNPLFRLPVQNIQSVESPFVRPSPSEHNDSIVLFVVVHGAVGAVRRYVAFGLDFRPLHSDCVEGPNVIHVAGVWVKEYVPAYPPKKRTSSSMRQQQWPHLRLGKLPALSFCLTCRHETFSILLVLEFYKCSIALQNFHLFAQLLQLLQQTSHF